MLRYIIGVSLIAITIIIIRALTNGKIQKRQQYALWLVIPVYMVVAPFLKINVPVADELQELFNVNSAVTIDAESYNKEIPDDLISQSVTPGNEYNTVANNETNVKQVTDNQTAQKNITDSVSLNWKDIIKPVIAAVSALMMVCLALFNIGFIIHCKRKRKYVGKDPVSNLEIFSIGHKGTPFLLINKIYVDEYSDSLNKYVICHEACHYKHGDSIWVILRYLVLVLNWYNPVIWAAFVLSGRDCELACDEEVLSIYGTEVSKEYAQTLFDLLQRQSRMSIGFTVYAGMKGGYKLMKKRIESIKNPAKKNYKVFAISLATLFALSSCSVMKPVADPGSTTEPVESSEESSEEITLTESETVRKLPFETEPFPSDYTFDYSDSPLNDVKLGHILSGGGYFMVAMTPISSVEEDGSKAYVVYPWRLLEVGQEFIDSLEVGKEISLESEAKLTVLETLDLQPDLFSFTVQEIEERYVESDHANWKYLTQFTGNRIYLRPDEERGLNFRETTFGTWALYQYDVPVMVVSKPVRLKVSPDVLICDSVHYIRDCDANDVVLTPEERKNALQCGSATMGYVSSIDEFFWRGCTSSYSENSPFDLEVENHTFTGICLENNVITKVFFY